MDLQAFYIAPVCKCRIYTVNEIGHFPSNWSARSVAMAQRHFKHPHPTFGRRLNPKDEKAWQKSVYFWWWQCLRRNDAYLKTCAKNGAGKLAALYRDFGDVREDDFKAWWGGNRGAELFAEPVTPNFIKELRTADEWDPNWTSQNVIVIAIPLKFPKRNLQKALNQLIRSRHTGKRGRPYQAISEARYQVKGNFNLPAIERAVEVYDCWCAARKQKARKPLWQIGLELEVNKLAARQLHELLRNNQGKARGVGEPEKRNLAAATSRYLRMAKAMIAAVEKGRFPR